MIKDIRLLKKDDVVMKISTGRFYIVYKSENWGFRNWGVKNDKTANHTVLMQCPDLIESAFVIVGTKKEKWRNDDFILANPTDLVRRKKQKSRKK